MLCPLFAACSCADTPAGDSTASSVTSASASTASAISDSTAGPLSGTWQDGDERITWRATAHEGALSEITETLTFGDNGQGQRTLRFDGNGALMRAEETRTQLMQQPDRTPAPSTSRFVVRLNGDSVLSATKTVDGVAVPTHDYDITRLRQHARAIADHIVAR